MFYRTVPCACPFPLSNIKNEVQESIFRVLRTLTELMGNKVDIKVKILLPPNPLS